VPFGVTAKVDAEQMGAVTDALFVQGNRFTRVYSFPEGDPTTVRERVLAAHQAPEFLDTLRRAAPMLSDPFDPEDPTSLAAFVQRHKMRVVLEAHADLSSLPPASAPGSMPASVPASMPASMPASGLVRFRPVPAPGKNSSPRSA